MRTIFVEKCNNDITVTRYIQDKFPALNKVVLFKALRNKDIKVNGKRINKDIFLSLNDKIDIYIIDKLLYNLPQNIDIIYEDDNLLVVHKPQGIISNFEFDNTKSIETFNEPTMEDLVLKKYPNALICHRLDRNTSGLLIFAKNKISYDELFIAFKDGYIAKKYIAYVSNTNFQKTHDILENYILKDNKNGYSKIYEKNISGTQKIKTEYSVIYTNHSQNYAVLNVIIHTGKTHQIRAHLKHISHPIIGDSMYGKNEVNKKFKIYKQLLFAYNYSFNFPENMKLSYLNNINIKLKDEYYNNKLGSDIYGNR